MAINAVEDSPRLYGADALKMVKNRRFPAVFTFRQESDPRPRVNQAVKRVMCAARTVLMVIMMLRHTVLLRCAVLHLCNQTIYLVNIVRLVRCATKLRHTLKQFFQIGGVLRAVDKPVNRVRIIRVAVGAGDFIQKCAVKDNIVAEAHCINRRAVEMIAHRYATFAIMTADDQIIIDAADIYLRHIMPSQMNLIVAVGVVVHIVNRVMPGMPVEAVHIVAAAAVQRIIAAAAHQHIIACACVNRIVARAVHDDIAARIALNAVITRPGIDEILAIGEHNAVVAAVNHLMQRAAALLR